MKITDRLRKIFGISFGEKEIYTEIRGRKTVLADGFETLLIYTDKLICVSSGNVKMNINGENLTLRHLSSGKIAACGRIDSIEYIQTVPQNIR